MKKLLLSMAIALMTLTATLYAACTQDVDMGGNKIKGLGNGTTDGDAVNYEQTVKQINVAFTCQTGWNCSGLSVKKQGGKVIITGRVITTESNVSSPILTLASDTPSQAIRNMAWSDLSGGNCSRGEAVHGVQTNGTLFVFDATTGATCTGISSGKTLDVFMAYLI